MCTVLYAETLEEVIQQAENAIAEKYKTPIAKKSAEKKLLAIIKDSKLPDEQKIETIKKQFPVEKQSQKTQDGDTETHYELGKNYLENGEYDKAISWLEKASSNNHKQAKELLKICIAATQGMRFSKDYKTLVKFYDHKRSECVIPEWVTAIGDKAFLGCKNLQSVTIPNSVTTIGKDAFFGCNNLQNVTIGNSVTTIGKYAFAYCSKLQSVTIPNSVTEIGEEAFTYCSKLQSVTISNSVTEIGEEAFKECKKLQSVTIGNSVTTIGERAFAFCSNLQSVTIPNSVTTIGKDAFAYCYNLKEVRVPKNCKLEYGTFPFDCTVIEY